MAIDPVFSSPAAPEPAPQRSRTSDARDAGSEFTLPERRDDPPAATQDSGRKSAEPAAKAPPPDAKAADGRKPDNPNAASETATQTAATAPTPASSAPATASPAADKPASPASDIGALASILAAAQGKDVTKAKSEAAASDATDPVKPGKKKTDEEETAASAAGPAMPAATPPAPSPTAADLLAILTATSVPVAAGAPGIAATGSAEAGGSQPASGSPAAVAKPGPETHPAAAAAGQAKAAAANMAGLIPSPAFLTGPELASSAETGDAAAVTVTAGLPAPARHAADGTGAALLDPAAAVPVGQPPADAVKLPETLQQALAPIDLSGLISQAPGKATLHPQPAAVPDPAAAAAVPLPQAHAAGALPTPLHVVPIEIGMRALAGVRSFDIRLDPAELGRVDVNLSISDKGEVSAKLVVDRVETLHLLQRDARTLERAFEQAGLKPSDSGVDISLRNDSGQAFRQQRQQDDTPQRQRRSAQTDDSDTVGSVSAVATQASRQIVRLGGVDLSI